MSESTFAAWVEPIATRLEQSRQDLGQLVPEIPDAAWQSPSAYRGWSYKDHLSHLPHAHRGLQGVLQSVVDGRPPDFSRFLRIDEMNEENRREHLTTPVDELLAAFARESEATEDLLARLTDEHAEYKLGPMTMNQALQGFAMHDEEHGRELRKALES